MSHPAWCARDIGGVHVSEQRAYDGSAAALVQSGGVCQLVITGPAAYERVAVPPGMGKALGRLFAPGRPQLAAWVTKLAEWAQEDLRRPEVAA